MKSCQNRNVSDSFVRKTLRGNLLHPGSGMKGHSWTVQSVQQEQNGKYAQHRPGKKKLAELKGEGQRSKKDKGLGGGRDGLRLGLWLTLKAASQGKTKPKPLYKALPGGPTFQRATPQGCSGAPKVLAAWCRARGRFGRPANKSPVGDSCHIRYIRTD